MREDINTIITMNYSLPDLNCTALQPTIAVGSFSYILAILFGVPACCIIIVTITGNFLVLCFKANVGKRQTSLLIWNLGLADFLVGVMVLPIGVAYTIGRSWPFGRWMCRLWTSCDVVFCTASIVTLCVISVDRYIGVTKPLRYKIIVTKRRVIFAIIGIWIFSLAILLVTIRYQPRDQCYNKNACRVMDELQYVVHSVVTAFFLPAIITLFLYWKIYEIARAREQCLKEGLIITLGDNFLTACVVNEPLRIHCGHKHLSKQRKVIRMHKVVAKTLGVVVSTFILCWLPFFLVYLISYHCQCVPVIVPEILTWLGYCNSMMNPIIYAFTIREFKQTLRSLFRIVRGRVDKANPAPKIVGGVYIEHDGQAVAGYTKNHPRGVDAGFRRSVKQRKSVRSRGRGSVRSGRDQHPNRRFSIHPDDEEVEAEKNSSVALPLGILRRHKSLHGDGKKGRQSHPQLAASKSTTFSRSASRKDKNAHRRSSGEVHPSRRYSVAPPGEEGDQSRRGSLLSISMINGGHFSCPTPYSSWSGAPVKQPKTSPFGNYVDLQLLNPQQRRRPSSMVSSADDCSSNSDASSPEVERESWSAKAYSVLVSPQTTVI